MPRKSSKNPEFSVDGRSFTRQTNQANFLAGLKRTGTIKNGCLSAGVARETYYTWVRVDPTVHDRVEEAKQEFAETLVEVVVGSVMDPEMVKKVPILAITLLNSNMPNKYRPTAIVQDETARDLLREWRKAARGSPREIGEVTKQLDEPIEDQIHEILKRKQSGEA